MTERPILFSAPMVRAILAGTKTQTRRVADAFSAFAAIADHLRGCRYQVGQHLWVRETWALHPDGDGVVYRATDPGWDGECSGLKWRPSIYMPRASSRITLEVTEVRVQRLQDLAEEDAKAEGCTGPHDVGYQAFRVPDDSKPRYSSAKAAFEALWDSINAKRPGCSWADNPWVWAITFRRVQP